MGAILGCFFLHFLSCSDVEFTDATGVEAVVLGEASQRDAVAAEQVNQGLIVHRPLDLADDARLVSRGDPEQTIGKGMRFASNSRRRRACSFCNPPGQLRAGWDLVSWLPRTEP